MKLTTWLSRAFPLERRPAAGGLLSGFLLAVILWLPLPEAVKIPAWLPPVLLLAALAVLLVLYAAGRPLLAPPHVLGWRGLGLAAAGLLLPLVPLGGAVRTASPPAAFLAAGLLLTAIHLIKTWRTAPTGSGS